MALPSSPRMDNETEVGRAVRRAREEEHYAQEQILFLNIMM
eukprot:CAMPEP_0117672776 /NCGR_PEP_ID=MMETSP0804-20121206/14098_1 /TAXON_ID=1074897 /ORGANISM="Tetraselmis astigmatica, Strain CCMP880" /LENGTH=40 /DNA_ID= /DNA_START= /DNA_END= /DNA_ORIENTATION=